MERKITLLAIAALLVLAFALPAAASDENVLPNFDPHKNTVKAAEAIAYVDINPAIQFGPAWGNISTTAHGTFAKFSGKFQTPFHTHSGSYHGVVIKGEMTNPFQGEVNPPVMGSGSYWFVPANSVHATACVSAEPCEFYFHADSHFDFVEHK